MGKTRLDLNNQTVDELTKIEGISKSLAEKIIDFTTTGTTKELHELIAKTPAGVIEMLGIKGLGPKKVRQLWQELLVSLYRFLSYS